MFDIGLGWMEMAVIALLVLVVIGPKELPRVMRSVAHWVRKARGLAREFQSGVDEMIREAELEDAKKVLDNTRRMDFDKVVEDTVDPTGSLREEAKDIEAAARSEPDGGAAKTPAESGDGKSDGEAADDEPKATIIKHPVQIAPPHSLTPPPAEDEAEAAVPAPDDDTTKKRA